jgi:alkanesulfonate monooxygenase SsuD/methylene tetrahydromethanopterin reductase-like flavin-dependent oxidoreductase (luciferase family)
MVGGNVKVAIEVDWQRRRFDVNRSRIELVDKLGYDVVFTAEANGSDALTPLGYILAATKRIGIGTRIVQNTARTAPATASAFQTLRHMAGPHREIVAGLGNSNRVRTEAWHGTEWTSPYWRMRDYVAIMRKVFAGEPVEHHGRVLSIPYVNADDSSRASSLRSMLEPDAPIKIMFGGGTDLMMRNAAEIADGLLPNGSWSPGMMKTLRPILEAGLAKRTVPVKLEEFPIWAHVDVLLSDDIKADMRQFKVYTATWVGSHPGKGGLHEQLVQRGYREAADRIRELWQAGHHDAAVDAVPDEYIDENWLIGPLPRVVERWKRLWVDDGCNLIVRTDNWPGAKPAGNELYEPLIRAMG